MGKEYSEMKIVSSADSGFSAAAALFFAPFAAAVLSVAQSAFAADTYIWDGNASADWNDSANWYKSGAASTHNVPSGAVNADFKEAYFSERFINDSKQVNFPGANLSNGWKVHVRSAGTEDAPVVFTAPQASYGASVGNTKANNNTGYYIANDTGTAYLELRSGTYRTASGGHWFVGSETDAGIAGHLDIKSGVNVMCSQTFNFRRGTVRNAGTLSARLLYIGTGAGASAVMTQAGGTLEASGGNIEIGRFGEGNTGTASLDLSNGTQASVKSNVHVGYSGAAGSKSTLNISTGAMFTVPGAVYLGNASAGEVRLGAGGELNVKGDGVRIGWLSTGDKKLDAGEDSLLDLDGGILDTQQIRFGPQSSAVPDGTATLRFNGGTVIVNGDNCVDGKSEHFIPAHDGFFVNVDADGANFNLEGRSVTIDEPFLAVENTAGKLNVYGGGRATFSATGTLAGPLQVGQNTAVRWFDQDGTVSRECAFTSLSLSKGATIYINGDATGVDALPAEVTTAATVESRATIVVEFSSIPASGTTFTLFPAASSDVFDVVPKFGDVVLPCNVSISEGNLVFTLTQGEYYWNGSGENWGDSAAWTKDGAAANWIDGNNAIFNLPDATAILAADASPAAVEFAANATIGGSSTLTASTISVAQDVTATVNAPTAGSLAKTGPGTLVIGMARSDRTTVSEGTLRKPASVAMDWGSLTLGTDPAKSVVFDIAGGSQSVAASFENGMDVTLANGEFDAGESTYFNLRTALGNLPARLAFKDASLTAGRIGLNVSDAASLLSLDNSSVVFAETKKNDNWIMQATASGALSIEMKNGSLMEFGRDVYALTCRDVEETLDPSLAWSVSDSTLRVKGGRDFRFGYDDSNKNPLKPEFTLAMTNSVLDAETGAIYIGHNVAGENTAGFYKADFVNTPITARQISVYADRPLNAVNFDGVTFNVTASGDSTIEVQDGAAGITVGEGGLSLVTGDYDCGLRADLAGPGAITKTGPGKLTVAKSQSGTGEFSMVEGLLELESGIEITRPVTLAPYASISIPAGVRMSRLMFVNGATLRIPAPLAPGAKHSVVETLVLPESELLPVTAADGGALAPGLYPLFETDVDLESKISVASDGQEWRVGSIGDLKVLAIGDVGPVWSGEAENDNTMSNPGNWLFGKVPGSGENADFSGVSEATTITPDLDYSLGAVTMGEGVITFTGQGMRAEWFSDTSKVAVAANSKVTVAGDLAFSNSEKAYIVHSVGAGGTFCVEGDITLTYAATGELVPFVVASDGEISAKGLVNNGTSSDAWYFRLAVDDEKAVHWAIGEDGISGLNNFWIENFESRPKVYIRPLDSDFAVTTAIGCRETATLVLDTMGADGETHTITVGNGAGRGGIVREGAVEITGGGTVVFDYDAGNIVSSASQMANTFAVRAGTVLALNAGSDPGNGTIAVERGATLSVPQTGESASCGVLSLANGAVLSFTASNGSVSSLYAQSAAWEEGASADIVLSTDGHNLEPGQWYTLLNAGETDISGLAFSATGANAYQYDLQVDPTGRMMQVKIVPHISVIRITDGGVRGRFERRRGTANALL